MQLKGLSNMAHAQIVHSLHSFMVIIILLSTIVLVFINCYLRDASFIIHELSDDCTAQLSMTIALIL